MPTKLEKLKSLVSKAMEAEALYMSLIGGGGLELKVCHAIFKWPDVIMAVLEDHIDQAIVDVSTIIVFAIRPIAQAYIIARTKGDTYPAEQLRCCLSQKIEREPDKRDVDDVLAWYEDAREIIKEAQKEES